MNEIKLHRGGAVWVDKDGHVYMAHDDNRTFSRPATWEAFKLVQIVSDDVVIVREAGAACIG